MVETLDIIFRWNDDERLVGIEWPTDPNGNKITR